LPAGADPAISWLFACLIASPLLLSFAFFLSKLDVLRQDGSAELAPIALGPIIGLLAASLGTVSTRMLGRFAEFFLITQVWFIANFHRAEAWAHGPIKFARVEDGAGEAWSFFGWTGEMLHYLDELISLLKWIDDNTYYAVLDEVFIQLLGKPDRVAADWILIVVGTIYVAWASSAKIFATVSNWAAKRAIHKRLQTDFENSAPILGGILVGFVLLGPIGAAIGGIFGAASKAEAKAELDDAERDAIAAQSALPSVLLGTVAAVMFDLVLQLGPYFLR
jgi:hypothetical protein